MPNTNTFTNTFDKYYNSYNKERADLNLTKTATSKNITISDWNDLIFSVETLIKNIENAYTFLQNTLGVFGSVYSDIGNTANSVTELGDSIDASVGNGDLWEKLKIDKTTLASDKISDIEETFNNYVSYVGYDATNHKIEFLKGTGSDKTLVNTVIVDKSYFDNLISDYAKLKDSEQEIEVASVQAETPEGAKYLVNRDTLNKALNNIIENIQADIARVVSSVYVYKDSVPTYEDLPKDASNGHVYNVAAEYEGHPEGTNYVWNGSDWEVLTGFIDTSKFLEKNTKPSDTPQVYTKSPDGVQGFINVDTGTSPYSLARRDGEGHVKTAYPAKSDDATSKKYVDEQLAEKAEYFEPYKGATYTIGAKTEDGQNVTVVVNYGTVAGINTVPLYSQGKLSCAEPTLGTDAVNLKYLNSQFKDISDFLGKFVDGGLS